MRPSRPVATRTIAIIAACSLAPWAHAQPDAEPETAGNATAEQLLDDEAQRGASKSPRDFSFSLRGNTEWVFPADLDESAGEVSIARIGAGIDVSFLVFSKSRIGISLGEELSFYDFKDATILPSGLDPIDDASETSLGLTYSTRFNERWSMFTGMNVLASAESGADFSDSLSFSGLTIFNYTFDERLTVGGGVLTRTRLEEDVLIIPVATVDWKINDKWNLSNAGGSSGARATLSYQHDDAWRFFADVGFEGREFRLDDEGPIPDGIARDQRIPIGLGAVYTPNAHLSVHARGGVHVLQSLEFDDSSGDEIVDTDVDPTGFISFLVSLRM